MPRRRTTRNKTKRPGPTLPAGDEGANIDVECRQEKVKTLIQDFENEVQSKLRALDLLKGNLISQIDLAYTMELMQIPAEVRSMKLTDFLSKGGSFEAKKSPVCSEVDNVVSSIINVNSNSDISSTSACQLEAIEEDENVPSTTTRAGRPRRKKADAPPTVRRGRSRQQAGDAATLQTPANRTRLTTSMMTPVITPKFDPRLYQTGAVTKRAMKPDEVVMSIDGSPLMNSNSTIMLPVNKSQSIAVQDVSELSNLDSGTAAAALFNLDQMREHLSAVINSHKTGK